MQSANRARAAQRRRDFREVLAGRVGSPLESSPFGGDTEPECDQGAVLEDNEVDKPLAAKWWALVADRRFHGNLLEQVVVVSVGPVRARYRASVDNCG